MTLFQKINKTCSTGNVAIVKTPNGKFMSVAPFKDCDGDWRESFICDTIEKARSNIGITTGIEEENWNYREEGGFTFHSAWRPEYERYEVWDVVIYDGRIYKVVDKRMNWTYTIKESGGRIYGVAHHELLPYFPEEKEETIEIDEVKYSLTEIKKALRAYKK